MIEQILERVTALFAPLPCVRGVVLGGSRATGAATEGSDVDIGLYYRRDALDYPALNAAAASLDDGQRENLICREGEWGPWVNFGGWLVIDQIHVDLIFRDLSRVGEVLRQTDAGVMSAHYQPGHPHAYLDVMYRGELAASRVLYAADGAFSAMKRRAERYPEALRKSLTDFFLFESDFSRELAEKYAGRGDAYYVAGHLFRSVSALNQVLFALNGQWCLNEKNATARAESFALRPDGYRERVNEIFRRVGDSPAEAASLLGGLCGEVRALCAGENATGGTT